MSRPKLFRTLMMGRCVPIKGVQRHDGWYIGPQSGPTPMLDIAQVHLTSSQDSETQEGWAKLFVAAPELYAALHKVVCWVDSGCDPSAKSMTDARAALAKAEGK